MDLTTLRTD